MQSVIFSVDKSEGGRDAATQLGSSSHVMFVYNLVRTPEGEHTLQQSEPTANARRTRMTENATARAQVLGRLRAADGAGVITIEQHFETGIDELWSALTERERLARWYGKIEGELRVGVEFRARVYASEWEGFGRIEECEPPRRFRIVSKDPDEPNEETMEVELRGDGGQTTLVVVQSNLPLELLWAYGAGLQIHVEDLAAHIAGRKATDTKTRFEALKPSYQQLAAEISRQPED